MKGYPAYVATKQDYINLLNIPEYKEQALQELQNLYNYNDDTITIPKTDPETGEPILNENDEPITEEIENPTPNWKLKEFNSREDILNLINTYKDEVG